MKNFSSKLVHFPDIRLLTPCKKVDFKIWDKTKLQSLFREMVKEMQMVDGFFHQNCLGISSNQIGYDLSMFVISKYPRSEKLKNKYHEVYINPEIVKLSDKTCLKWEGCISEQENLLLIKRPQSVILKYQDITGKIHEVELPPVKSRVALHEIDHLNGVSMSQLNIYGKQETNKLHLDKEYLNKWVEVEDSKEHLI